LTDWSGRKIPITGLVEPPPEVKAMVDPFEPKSETIDEEVIFEDEPMDNLF
jgi:hypothetical protein